MIGHTKLKQKARFMPNKKYTLLQLNSYNSGRSLPAQGTRNKAGNWFRKRLNLCLNPQLKHNQVCDSVTLIPRR